MNFILSTIMVFSLSICAVTKDSIKEDLTVEKPTSSKIHSKVIIYKKVPTKWVKITKKSN